MARCSRFLFLAVLAAVFSAAASAEQNYSWDFSVQAVSGGEAHWTSPGPVDTSYLRYYARTASHVLLEVKLAVFWVPVYQSDLLEYGEVAGPIPPAGVVLYQDHIVYVDPDFTIEADVSIYVDGAGYFHVDVTNLTSTKPVRITTGGTLKIQAKPFVYGDIAEDGRLDPADAVAYAQSLAGSLPFPGGDPALFDMDCSGVLDSRDLALIQSFIDGNTATAYIGWDF